MMICLITDFWLLVKCGFLTFAKLPGLLQIMITHSVTSSGSGDGLRCFLMLGLGSCSYDDGILGGWTIIKNWDFYGSWCVCAAAYNIYIYIIIWTSPGYSRLEWQLQTSDQTISMIKHDQELMVFFGCSKFETQGRTDFGEGTLW